eukprot:GHVH01007792.1.p1 GENE.GHVH01007792.1~~GHVH01007792.1.p1  ORF type:complete len:530 (+),score=46.80 GHVH01007792.1:101-1690(+)
MTKLNQPDSVENRRLPIEPIFVSRSLANSRSLNEEPMNSSNKCISHVESTGVHHLKCSKQSTSLTRPMTMSQSPTSFIHRQLVSEKNGIDELMPTNNQDPTEIGMHFCDSLSEPINVATSTAVPKSTIEEMSECGSEALSNNASVQNPIVKYCMDETDIISSNCKTNLWPEKRSTIRRPIHVRSSGSFNDNVRQMYNDKQLLVTNNDANDWSPQGKFDKTGEFCFDCGVNRACILNMEPFTIAISSLVVVEGALTSLDGICNHEQNIVPILHNFDAKTNPRGTLSCYLQRLRKYMCASDEVFILGFIYVLRIHNDWHTFRMLQSNAHRIVLLAMVLAAKFFDDHYFSNAFYAKVGGVTNTEINRLEINFLRLSKYNLFVTSEEYEGGRRAILAYFLKLVQCGDEHVNSSTMPLNKLVEACLYQFNGEKPPSKTWLDECYTNPSDDVKRYSSPRGCTTEELSAVQETLAGYDIENDLLKHCRLDRLVDDSDNITQRCICGHGGALCPVRCRIRDLSVHYYRQLVKLHFGG